LQSHLLAAFNSGLPSIYGDFGLANRQGTFVPPTPGLATVALYRDRRVRIGIWGRDLRPAPDLVALRQNCLLLVDRGQLDAREEEYDLEPASPYCRRRPTWRSGIGITAEGRLLYAAGNALTLRTLGQALRLAGAQQAMQLDIGRDFIRFDTFTDRPGLLPNAHNLIRAMIGDDNDYLRPEKRDFFYLTYSTH
jgi:hypothetical protein